MQSAVEPQGLDLPGNSRISVVQQRWLPAGQSAGAKLRIYPKTPFQTGQERDSLIINGWIFKNTGELERRNQVLILIKRLQICGK
jgi:hypothetical protein